MPPHAALSLVFTAVLSVMLAGNRYGTAGDKRFGAMAGYIAVVCLVAWVRLDLDQPQSGWIEFSQEPMQRSLKSLTD